MDFIELMISTFLLLVLFFYLFAGLYNFLFNGKYENADNTGFFTLKEEYQKKYCIFAFFLLNNKIKKRLDKIFSKKETYENLFDKYFIKQ